MSDLVSNGYLKDKNGKVMEIVDKAARDGVNRLTEEIAEIKENGAGGGGSAAHVVIMKPTGYDDFISGIAPAFELPKIDYEPSNMPFNEAINIILSGGVLDICCLAYGAGVILAGFVPFYEIHMGEFGMFIWFHANNQDYYWTESGVSTTDPREA